MPEPIRREALLQLRLDVPLRWPQSRELSQAEIKARFPHRTGIVAGWYLPNCIDEEPADLMAFVDSGFPWTLPLLALPMATNGISVPHVEKDGHLCLTPSSASFSLPVGLAHLELLISDAENVLRLGRSHANDADFLTEAHSYWSLMGEDCGYFWLTQPAPNGHELWAGTRLGSDWAVGGHQALLMDWVKSSGRLAGDQEPCIVLRLAAPLLPTEYPRTSRDFLALAASVGAQNIVDQAIKRWKGQRPLPFVLVFTHAGNDVCLGGLLLSPFTAKIPNSRGSGVPGFRKNGKVHPKAVALVPGDFPHLRCIPVYRQYLTTRTAGAVPSRLTDAHVVVIGCGAIGGELAVQLAKAGIGNLTLVDGELFDWRNVGRHVLNGNDVGKNKAAAVKAAVLKTFPDAKVTIYSKRWEMLGTDEVEAIQKADIIIAVTGEVASNLRLDALVTIGEMPTTVFGFTEAFASAGHAVLQLAGSGRLRTLTTEFGILREPVADLSTSQDLPQEPSCGAFYQPYSSLAALATVSLIGELAIDGLLGKVATSTHRVWVGSVDTFSNNGLSMSEVWRRRVNKVGDNRRFSFPVPATE